MSLKSRLESFSLWAMDMADLVKFSRLSRESRTLDEKLVKAAYTGDATSVLELLAQGANPNSNRGPRPLAIAVHSRSVACVDALLSAGASPRRCPGVLMLAAGSCGPEIIKALVRHGADIEEIDENDDPGMTPVLRAAKRGNIEGIAALIDLGARLDPPHPLGLHPVQMAAERNQVEMLSWLLLRCGLPLSPGTRRDPASHYAASHLDGQCLRALLAAGTPVNERGRDGMTITMVAAVSNAPICLSILDEAGADFDLRQEPVAPNMIIPGANFTGVGRTATQMAAQRGHEDAWAWMLARAERRELSDMAAGENPPQRRGRQIRL